MRSGSSQLNIANKFTVVFSAAHGHIQDVWNDNRALTPCGLIGESSLSMRLDQEALMGPGPS